MILVICNNVYPLNELHKLLELLIPEIQNLQKNDPALSKKSLDKVFGLLNKFESCFEWAYS